MSVTQVKTSGVGDDQITIDKITFEGALIPIGGIIMWSGSIASIPTGWALCNGSNGTPDLRDRFVAGAGNSYAVNDTGGANNVALTTNQIPSHSHSGSAASAGSHSHTASSSVTDPGHSHPLTFFQGSHRDGGGVNFSLAVNQGNTTYNTNSRTTGITVSTTVNSGGTHSHSLSIDSAGGGQSHENRPPFYALAFIMRVS